MPKISGLIFSADPIKETLAAAKHLLEFTDEVVVLYAGTTAQYKKFANSIHDRRIKSHYTLKIGYPEPFRHYGIGFCKYNLIAMLDVDERFSDTEAAKRLMDSGEADIYRLQRHEVVKKDKNSKLYTKQYRLFKKGSLEWKGLLHETPKIHGKIKDIRASELHIIHKTGENNWNYNKLNEVFPIDRPILMAARDAYVQGSFNRLSYPNAFRLMIKKYSGYQKNYSKLPQNNKKIIAKLRKDGIINYLGLNTREGAETTIRRYSMSNIQGINLLIKMLYDRFSDTK